MNSTCHMIEDIPKLLVTNSEKEDRFYSLEPLCDILQERKIAEHFFAHVWYYAWRAVFHDPESFMRYRFRDVLGKNRAPLYLSIGGDMYCYELSRKEAVTANSTFVRAGARTILWGCSLEPELLEDQTVVDDMKRYTQRVYHGGSSAPSRRGRECKAFSGSGVYLRAGEDGTAYRVSAGEDDRDQCQSDDRQA